MIYETGTPDNPRIGMMRTNIIRTQEDVDDLLQNSIMGATPFGLTLRMTEVGCPPPFSQWMWCYRPINSMPHFGDARTTHDLDIFLRDGACWMLRELQDGSNCRVDEIIVTDDDEIFSTRKREVVIKMIQQFLKEQTDAQ